MGLSLRRNHRRRLALHLSNLLSDGKWSRHINIRAPFISKQYRDVLCDGRRSFSVGAMGFHIRRGTQSSNESFVELRTLHASRRCIVGTTTISLFPRAQFVL